MTDDTYNLHLQGTRCFEAGYYGEAERYYRWALELDEDRYEHLNVLKFDLATAWQMTGRFKDAARFYYQEIVASGEYAGLAREELTKLQERQRQWSAPANAQPLTSDDQRFLDIAAPMLSGYPALVRPLHIAWVDESGQSLRWIQEIQKNFGLAHENCLQTLAGWEALGLIIGYWHMIMVKSDWQKAKDSALRGLLSHELAHAEMKDTSKGCFADPHQSLLGFICNERERLICWRSPKGMGATYWNPGNFRSGLEVLLTGLRR